MFLLGKFNGSGWPASKHFSLLKLTETLQGSETPELSLPPGHTASWDLWFSCLMLQFSPRTGCPKLISHMMLHNPLSCWPTVDIKWKQKAKCLYKILQHFQIETFGLGPKFLVLDNSVFWLKVNNFSQEAEMSTKHKSKSTVYLETLIFRRKFSASAYRWDRSGNELKLMEASELTKKMLANL